MKKTIRLLHFVASLGLVYLGFGGFLYLLDLAPQQWTAAIVATRGGKRP